jgi:hypothetical protein
MALSNILEELIHAGKAEFKVFSAGGSQKSILNIQQNSYIIITNVLFQPQFLGYAANQLNIVSEGKLNSLIFRNTLVREGATNYNSPISVDTYFMHKTSVMFCLSNTDIIDPTFSQGTFDHESIGFRPIFDYGKQGIAGSSAVLTKVARNSALQTISFQGNTITHGANFDFHGLNFPMTNLTFNGQPENQPLVTISYVEVFVKENKER